MDSNRRFRTCAPVPAWLDSGSFDRFNRPVQMRAIDTGMILVSLDPPRRRTTMPLPLVIDPATTALVLVDLQNVTMAMPVVPHAPEKILGNSVRLADRCRAKGVLVVLIKVSVGVGGNYVPRWIHPFRHSRSPSGGMKSRPNWVRAPAMWW